MVMNMLVGWIALTLAIWVAAQVVPGIKLKSPASAFVAGAILGVLNLLLAKLLFWALAIGTLGLAWLFGFFTRWLIAAVLFKVTDAVTDELEVNGILPAIVGGGLVAVVASVATWILGLFGL